MIQRLMFTLSAIALTLALGGCSTSEYVIVEPSASTGRLTKQEREIARDPLVYFFTDNSNRLRIRIENPTDDSIALLGEKSYLVTPDGQSQPLRSGTIAPHTWSGFTVPPLVREYRRSGMSFGVGVGSWGGGGGGFVGAGYDPFYDDFAYAPTDVPAWTWKSGTVRMHLVFERQGETPTTFEHDWMIDRVQVK